LESARSGLYSLALHDALPILADQRDGRHVAPRGDLALLARLDLPELGLQVLDPVRDEAAVLLELLLAGAPDADAALVARQVGPRSEEHTSELQSRFDLVCRLL